MPQDVASYFDLTKLKNTWADFQDRYAVLSSTAYGAEIAKSNDYDLLVRYGRTLESMAKTKARVEATLRAYEGAKEFVGLSGLGVIPIMGLAVVAGVVTVLISGINLADNFMKSTGINRIQRENPGMSTSKAAAIYDQTHQSVFSKALDTTQLILLLGGGALLWFLFFRK